MSGPPSLQVITGAQADLRMILSALETVHCNIASALRLVCPFPFPNPSQVIIILRVVSSIVGDAMRNDARLNLPDCQGHFQSLPPGSTFACTATNSFPLPDHRPWSFALESPEAPP